MNHSDLKKLLQKFRKGEIREKDVLDAIQSASIQSLEFAHIDHHREIRQGFPEVIFCEGKTPEQVLRLTEKIFERHHRVLATRAGEDIFKVVQKNLPGLEFNAAGRCIYSPFPEIIESSREKIAIITAGTSDVPVATEASITCRLFGYEPREIYDVGVAGLHRLNKNWDAVKEAKILIVIAGMEGALASVIGGLVDKPVIAVPTSIGYGTSFGGITALFGMLNSCSSNVTVVNIDNGFGAAFSACLILRQILLVNE